MIESCDVTDEALLAGQERDVLECIAMKSHARFTIGWLSLMLSGLLLLGCTSQNDPDLPTESGATLPYDVIGFYPVRGTVNDLALVGQNLYAAEHSFGLTQYDVSDPSNITLQYHRETNQRPIFVEAAPWNNLLIAGFDDHLQGYMLDNSLTVNNIQPYTPCKNIVMFPDTSTQSSEFDFEMHHTLGTRLLRFGEVEGMQIDYYYPDSSSSPPTSDYSFTKSLLDQLSLNPFGSGITSTVAVDSFFVVAVSLKDVGVGFIQTNEEVRDGYNWLSDIDTPGEAFKIVYQDGFVFVADGNNGLAIINASDVNNPELVATWYEDGVDHAVDIAVQGDYLVLMDQYDGLYFFDISNPIQPKYMGASDFGDPTAMVFVDDGILIVTSSLKGMQALQLLY